jgi:uncharacterized protein (DUF362 family)
MIAMSPARKFFAAARSLTRREFSHGMGLGVASIALGRIGQEPEEIRIPLALVKSSDRKPAIRRAVESLADVDLKDRNVLLKPSFNSPHPFPATTHPETLEAVVEVLRAQGCGGITLVERSGMGSTRKIMNVLGIDNLAQRLNLEVIDLEELPPSEWRDAPLPESHWNRGVQVPKFIDRAYCLVQICNLRTHRFGGIYSAGLKNLIGLIAKRHKGSDRPYNYMKELHESPHQRSMIAEVNQLFRPELVIMDASQIFIRGGPETGDLAYPEAIAASQDTVAVDAVGVALLRLEGAGKALSSRAVFEQDQIKRAVELELGVKSEKEIDIKTEDLASTRLGARIKANMRETVGEKKL